METTLSLVETDTLLLELESRFNAIVFAGVQFRTKEEDYIRTHYNGSTMALVGLCSLVQRDMLEHMTKMRLTDE